MLSFQAINPQSHLYSNLSGEYLMYMVIYNCLFFDSE